VISCNSTLSRLYPLHSILDRLDVQWMGLEDEVSDKR